LQFVFQIIFDESHKAKGYNDNEFLTSSTTGDAVIKIQSELKSARVLYVSATLATEISEIQYMSRLGLWGRGTVFLDSPTFVEAAVKR
jgi:protein strawberry notch